MLKISKTIFAALQVVLNHANATYSNLLYNVTPVAYPSVGGSACGTLRAAWATDRVITHYETGGCGWFNYLFYTEPSADSNRSLTITLPAATTVRTVLLSARDRN
jgi:hypothetical protein